MSRLSFVAAAAAVMITGARAGCNVQTDTAFVGFDIGYFIVNASDVNSCQAACTSQPLCAAFTLYPNGRCFTKTNGSTANKVVGALSCTVAPGSVCPMGLSPCPANTTSPGACAQFSDTCNIGKCPPASILCPEGTCLPPTAQGWAQCPQGTVPPYYDSTQPLESRVQAVISAMTVEDIAPQLNNQGYGQGPPGPPGIPRLSIPPYNWLNEGLHGVARSGLATSFPQISVAGQSWNRSSWWWIGRVLGLEARVKHTMNRRGNQTTEDYTGVTYYAPNINIGRDPRWGRIQEVPTEDPTLMAAYGTAVVQGAQATGVQAAPPAWLVDPVVRGSREGMRAARAPKPLPPTSRPVGDDSSTSAIIACCKHAVAYSVEEYQGVPRAGFNALVSGPDMLDTYLPAFQACFMQGGGRSSMCSYNSVNGVPTCASHFLLNTTIRQRYGMGENVFIMSDYGAVGDAFSPHNYCPTKDQCTAAVLAAGVDQDGGGTDFAAVSTLIQEGYLTEAQVRTAAARLFRARISLGLLNTPETVPYVSTLDAPSTLDSDFHRQLSLEAAQQGIVLLQNQMLALPLNASAIRKVAMVGPNADVPDVLYGNYQGTPPYLITPRAGMIAALGGDSSRVYYAPGCLGGVACPNTTGFADAVAAASQPDADAVIIVLGIDQSVEAEGKDRVNLTLPGQQVALAQAVCAVANSRKVPCILIYVTGGPIADPWGAKYTDAALVLGYASQSAGTALAQVLFGQVSPSGKLAVTWPASVDDLPPMGDMGMRPNATAGTQGRTYRFNPIPALWPFGHGASYTTWSAGPVVAPPSPIAPCTGINLTVPITNTGSIDAGLVVQVYVSWPSSVPGAAPPPLLSLAEFERVFVRAGETTSLTLTIPPHALALVNASAAASFAQDFAMPDPAAQARALSGRAFGLSQDYHSVAAQAGAGPIGWDDMFFLPTGTPFSVWVGSGQPGDWDATGLQGQSITLSLAGVPSGGINLAQCDLDLWTQGE